MSITFLCFSRPSLLTGLILLAAIPASHGQSLRLAGSVIPGLAAERIRYFCCPQGKNQMQSRIPVNATSLESEALNHWELKE